VGRKLLSALFVSAGLAQLVGPWFVRDRFARWGYPDWFRTAVGVWELEAATMLWSSQLRTAGAAQLGLLLLGAIYTHAQTPGESMQAIAPAITLLALTRVAGQ
jgi:uncharacterized membrane protein YphA (DoxX/SURF4 family)